MDFTTAVEIPIVLFLQSLGEWLKTPMLFFSFLGQEETFLLLLPFLYWCVDARLGIQFAVMMVLSNWAVSTVKLGFRLPRPFWLDSRVLPLSAETSFGLPSGHATTAAGVWGVLANFFRKRWVSIILVILIFLIGISRVYLGMHFLSQVLIGWIFGGGLLWLVVRISPTVMHWFNKFSLPAKFGWIFLSALILVGIYYLFFLSARNWQAPALWVELGSIPLEGEEFGPIDLDTAFTLAGTWFGGMSGAAWYAHRKGILNTSGSWRQKTLRFLLGITGVLILWYGLGAIFPRTPTLDAYLLRFLRYTILGAWMTVIAPLIFIKLKLLNPKSDHPARG